MKTAMHKGDPVSEKRKLDLPQRGLGLCGSDDIARVANACLKGTTEVHHWILALIDV